MMGDLLMGLTIYLEKRSEWILALYLNGST